ncbi:MAG: sugar phosphate isomerase/epimerase [Eubacteriaceae bacterium]|nr:sugar phosphate isomerase/epimerase [Eubacteriaceae bacterium]
MKTGIFTWFGYILPFDEKLRLIKEAGFDAVCVWWGNEFAESDGSRISQMEAALKAGLDVDNGHLPYYGCDKLYYSSLDGEERFGFYRESIAQAGRAGLDRLVMHPFELSMPADGNIDFFVARLNTLIEEGARSDVAICLENLPDMDSFHRIVQKADGRLRICYDSGHNHKDCGDDLSFLDRYRSRIAAVHLHDNDTSSDSHLIPGEGTIRWDEVRDALALTSYDRSMMLECALPYDQENDRPEKDIKPEEYLREAIASLHKYFGRE